MVAMLVGDKVNPARFMNSDKMMIYISMIAAFIICKICQKL